MRPVQQSPDDLINIKQVVALCGVSESTLYRLLARNQFPKPLKITPQIRRWIRAEIIAWRDARAREREAA